MSPTGIYMRTKEHNQKISKRMVGNQYSLGRHRPLSEETKRRISDFHKGTHLSEETKRKISTSRKGQFIGENNPAWKGGISFLLYPSEWTETLKESIRQRDNHTCQLCGKTEKQNGRKLDVHHIDYNKEDCDPRNLITLCNSCNIEVNSDRSIWEKFFNRKLKLLGHK